MNMLSRANFPQLAFQTHIPRWPPKYMYISVPLTIKNTVQWLLGGSVFVISIVKLYIEVWKKPNWHWIIESFPLCIRYFKAVRLSNHSVPARSKLFAAISVMEIIIVFTINMINMYERPGSIVSLNLWELQNSSPEVVGHHAGTPLVISHGRRLQFKETQLWSGQNL